MKLSPKLNLPIPEGSDIHNLTNFVTLLNAIDNNAAPLETMNNHINNKNNPHAVTKAQVGLSQVNNVSQYSKGEMDSKLSDLSKLTQLPANSVPSTGTPASFPIGVTVMTVTTGYPGATTNSPKTVMTIRGSNDRGTYQLLSSNGTPQQRAYDGVAWGGWSTVATTASNVASATKLANARKIGGVAFNGTSDIALPGVNAPGNQPTSGKATTAGRADTATHADNATSANKLTNARKIGGVTFDGTTDVALPGVNTVGNQDTTGKAATAGRSDTAGTADAANKLTNARKIGGVSFDGSADISLPGVNTAGNQSTSGKAATAGRSDTAGIADVANKLTTPRKIGGVSFDGSADVSLPGVNTAGNQDTSGKAATAGTADIANKLTTPRKIGGVAFDGSADVSLPGVNIAGNQDTSGKAATAGRAETSNIADAANKLSTPRKIGGVAFDGSAPIDLPGVNIPGNQDTSGKAATAGVADSATRLANTRKIGGVNFDATANINLPGVNITGNQNTSGRAATAGRAETAGTADVAVRLNVPRKIGGVTFDGTKDVALPGVNTAGNQDTSGKAASAARADMATYATKANKADEANKLTTARKIGGVNFDGSGDISLPGVNTPGNQPTSGKAAFAGSADVATAANKLTTARKIGGVYFDGTQDIVLPGVNAPSNQDTGWRRLAITNATGNLFIRRKESDVWISGTIASTTESVPAKSVELCSIPVGYRVDRTDGHYKFMSAFSPTKDTRYRFQNKGDGIQMLYSLVAADEYAIDWHWMTLDDFPN